MTPNSGSDRLRELGVPLAKIIIGNPLPIGTLILFETGVIIVLLSYLSNNPSYFVEFSSSVGKAMIISAFAGFVYDSLLKNRSTTDVATITENFTNTSNEMERSIKRLIEEGDGSIKKLIEEGKNATFSDTFIKCFLDSDLVTKSGLVKVHTSREAALKSFVDKIDQIKDPSEFNIYLSGITLGDFLLERGDYYNLLTHWINNRKMSKTYIIILDKESEAAIERARREEPQIFNDNGYKNTSVYNELNSTEKRAEILLHSHPGKINVKKSNIYPLCFLAAVNDTMIVEPYNYARRGGGAPVLEIIRSSNDNNSLYHNYMRHFVSLWAKPCQGKEKMTELCESIRKYDYEKRADIHLEQSGKIESCE